MIPTYDMISCDLRTNIVAVCFQGDFMSFSGMLRRLAVKLSKIANVSDTK